MSKLSGFILILMLIIACKTKQKTGTSQMNTTPTHSAITHPGSTQQFLAGLLNQNPQYFNHVINDPEYKVQIIYSQIDRNRNGRAKFTDYYFNPDDSNYFYPASTVKLPVALLALQKLNELNMPGLDKNSMMITEAAFSGQTEVYNDPGTPDGTPTIAHYIKKILLVSDNDAFNRLYEFLGQEYINNALHRMGYSDVEIIHRLDISLTEEENRHTNPVRFYDNTGKLVYEQEAKQSQWIYTSRNTKLGKGFMRNGQLVNEPFDFSKKNRMTLKSLHGILRSVLFPEMISASQRFNLTPDDYEFLRKYMSMLPSESNYPFYNQEEFHDSYVKFLYYGNEKVPVQEGLRIFNKVGDAYGFLIDGAYFADFKNQVEFMLSAVIYCNRDGILNDNKYDYDSIGFPFMKHLGRVIYEYELKREKKVKPDLSTFIFDYTR